jgi:hypothetical protein
LSKYRLAKYKLLSVRGLKSGSFGFSALGCVSAKTKCAVCAMAIQNILCVGEKIKTQKGQQ